MKRLSVIIVNWNTRDLLEDCLASVRDTLPEADTEIIVVDNGSVDGSVSMVKSRFPEVKLMENHENLGFAKANNMALRVASGRFFLLLNSDTVLKEGAIEGLLRTMEEDPAIGIAGLQLLNGDGSFQNSISNIPSLLTELTNKSLLRLLFPTLFPGKEHRFEEPVEVEAVIGACMMVRREAADVVGLLDEDYFFFLEETDWCLRMKRAGWKVVHDPGASILHLQGKSAGRMNGRSRIEYWRSRYTFFRKHYGMPSRLALRAGLMCRLLLSSLLSLIANGVTAFSLPKLRNKSRVYLQILSWHLHGCPEDGGLRGKLP